MAENPNRADLIAAAAAYCELLDEAIKTCFEMMEKYEGTSIEHLFEEEMVDLMAEKWRAEGFINRLQGGG